MTQLNTEFARYPSLKDRAVLISGGGSGIGAALVKHFTYQGARVAFIDIDEVAARQVCHSLENHDVEHQPGFRQVDVKDLDVLRSEITDLSEAFGGFSVLVNNAANDQRHSIGDVTPEFWRDRMAVNLDHQFFASQAVVEQMARNGGGSIINMGSCSWRLGLGELSAYVTAKAAIEGLTNGLARELGEKKIRVNCVIPGFIKTERQIKLWLTPELEKTIMDGQCLKELIEPEYVANLVAFLASDDAAMCSSGTYSVDGGWI